MAVSEPGVLDDILNPETWGIAILVAGTLPTLAWFGWCAATILHIPLKVKRAGVLQLASVLSVASVLGFVAGITVSPVAVTLLTSLFGILSAAFLIIARPGQEDGADPARPAAFLVGFFFAAFLFLLIGLDYSEPKKAELFCEKLFVENFSDKPLLDLFEEKCNDRFDDHYLGDLLGF